MMCAYVCCQIFSGVSVCVCVEYCTMHTLIQCTTCVGLVMGNGNDDDDDDDVLKTIKSIINKK